MNQRFFLTWTSTVTKMIMIITVFCLISCRPLTKEAYLEKYGLFMNEITEKSESFTEKEWQEADRKHQKFSEKWYQHFKDKLSLKEKMLVTRYKIQYTYYKYQPGLIDLYNDLIKGNFDKLREKIKYYKENQMEQDLESLLKMAREVGDTSLIIIEQLIREAEKEVQINQ